MLKLAWRNLWRNKRRTLITAASVMFAVIFAVLLRGYHGGAWASLIDSVLHSYSGYLQIHGNGFWEDKNFDNSMEWNDTVKNQIVPGYNVSSVIPRVEAVALASIGEKTKIVIVLGVEPTIEEKFSALSKRLKEGSLLNNTDSAVLVSQRLAKFLNVGIGDTLTLISQGYQGASAAGLFKIKGIIKLPAPEFDNQMVFMPLKVSQDFFSLGNRVTSVVVDIKNPAKLKKTALTLNKKLDLEKYEIMTWEEMLEEFYQQYVSDEGGGKVFLALLYLVIGFGIFGTVMMMVAERTREFGVLLAIGMKRARLFWLISFEMLFIAFIGVVAGMFVSIPIVAWFHFHPIEFSGAIAQTFEVYGMEPVIPVLWQADYILYQGLVVFIITLVAIIYPIFKVRKLKVVEALRK